MPQFKPKNKKTRRSLCPFIATTYEELDLHYSLTHDDSDDLFYELAMKWENMKKKKEKKPKTLKDKALYQLKLMVEGVDHRNEYVGLCTTKYEIYTKKMKDRYVIKLRPGIEVC